MGVCVRSHTWDGDDPPTFQEWLAREKAINARGRRMAKNDEKPPSWRILQAQVTELLKEFQKKSGDLSLLTRAQDLIAKAVEAEKKRGR